jgi:acyl transferase domain-containing protein
MARELFDAQPVFRSTLERCDAILRGKLDTPLLDLLYASDPGLTEKLNQTAFTQPALFAIEYALAQMWLSWGVKPAALLGHSVGEYVGACLAGVFTLEEGLDLIAARGRLMQALPAGAMAAVFAPEADVAEAIRSFAPVVSMAAVNGPEDVVISGPPESVEAVVALLAARSIASRRLTVSHAFHSASMDPILDEFERIAGGVRFKPPALPIVSNLTGEVAGAEIASAEYWRRHLRETVRFAAGVQTLVAQGCRVLLEVGPKPTLTGLAKGCVARSGPRSSSSAADASPSPVLTFLPSLKPPRGEWQQVLDSVASLYAAGASIDWTAFDAPYAPKKVDAPRYPFQRERYWLDGSGLVRAESGAERPVTMAMPPAPAQTAADAYRVEWIQVNGAAAPPPAGARTWIIVPDSGTVGSQLAAVLRERGDRCHVVAGPEDLRHALDGDGVPAGVLHLANLDAATLPGMTAIDLERAQLESASGLLHLVQTLLEHGVNAPVHVITRGVHEVGGDGDPAVAQAAVWGLARTLAVEHPELWGGLIDIGGDTTAAQLLEAIDAAGEEDQLALRGGTRYAPRLKRAPQFDRAFAGCRPDASYLVTGGLGVIGLEIARWLAMNGARHVVLVGRTGVPARSEWDSLVDGSEAARRVAGIREIERAGATVHVAAVDISDYRDAAALVKSFGTSMPPLRGIVHAAATMGAAKLRGMTPAALAAMLKPKARGAWVLHRLTEDIELDFFVLFSSVSALLGTADLAHYGAANAVLDGFAEYRRSRGLTAVSINWGAWENLRGSAEHKDVFARSGMRSLPIAAALEALGNVLASDTGRAVIAAVDWNTFKPVYEAKGRRPFLGDVDAGGAAQPSAQPPQERATLHDEIAVLDPESHRDAIVAHVRAAAAAVLGLAPRQVDPARGFFDLGMDSLLSVELRRRLEASTGLPLPTTLTFKYPTVAAIADYLLEQRGGQQPAATAPGDQPTTPEDGELSEEELATLLASKLSQIR